MLLSFAVPQADPASDVIVILHAAPGHEASVTRSVAASARAQFNVRASRLYVSAISGFAGRLTTRQQTLLARDPRVEAIVPDTVVALVDDVAADFSEDSLTPAADETPGPDPTPGLDPTPGPSPTPKPRPRQPTPGPDFQVVPTGVQRIGRQDLDRARIDGTDRRVDADIAIIDTGVNAHPDLNVVGGRDCTGKGSWGDPHGHGTHVAGTAAALDNDFGVVGVAPGARIWSVRVLDRNGYGRASWLLCGIDWVAAQREGTGQKPVIEVANMSLRLTAATSPADDGNCGWRLRDAIHRAVCRAVDLGIAMVAAAGNDNRNARRYRPAAYREVITVSALSDFDGKAGRLGSIADNCPAGVTRDRDDVLANFSNYGRTIDIMAPGKCIWSTSRSGGYRAMSGTSMATPHVSGAVALYRAILGNLAISDIRRRLMACSMKDWLLRSDKDRYHEPLLHMNRFCT